MSLNRLKLLGKLRITDFTAVKVSNADAHAVFHFARAKIMQERAPTLVFFEIFGRMFGEKNVPGVTAIHYPLRHVDPSSRDVRPLVHVHYPTDWPAVNSHPKLETRMFLERATDLHRGVRRRFRTRVKYQRHPIAGRDF